MASIGTTSQSLRKIRIGNDIALQLTLNGPKNFNSTNIKSIRCYLVNTSILDAHQHASHCPSRYPGHCCNRWMNWCGGCCGGCCGSCCGSCFGRHPYFVTPWGFRRVGCLWYDPIPCGLACDQAPIYDDFIDPYVNQNAKYICDARVLGEKNKIEVFFPARHQQLCGDYKLVLTVEVYEAGWGNRNIHTFTNDYGIIFSLVDDDSADVDTDVVIDIDRLYTATLDTVSQETT